MAENIRMSKSMVECFTAKVNYGDGKVEVLFVPLFGGKPGWVGPGYWKPQLEGKVTSPPPFNYNTRIYTRDELMKAGAKSKFEYLWMR
jgi:hypothetical protein